MSGLFQRAICLAALTTCFAPIVARAADDEAAVRELVRKYVDARDRIDPAATEALFTKDADQLVSTGEWRKGRDELVRGAMASSREEGKRTITVETVRFLSPDLAIVDGRYQIAGAVGTRAMWTTLVMTRTADGWRIAAIRNMLPSAPAAPAPK
jgi:uncharacterized protein (TIGR02246 family)